MASRESGSDIPWYLHPMRVHGGIQILLGLTLLGLGLHAHGVAKLQVDLSLNDASLSNLQGLYGEISGNPLLAVRIGGPLLVMLVSLIAGLTHLVSGIGRATQVEQANRRPEQLGDVDQVIDSVVNARLPHGIDAKDSFMQFVRANFTDRLDFVPKSYSTLIRDYLWYLITVAVILGGLLILRDQVLMIGTFEKVGKLYFALPFAGALIGVLLGVVIVRFAFAALLLPKTPEANVAVDRQQFSAAGHPRTVLEELKSALVRIGGGRLGDVLAESDMVLEQDPVGDVGRAKASLVIEGQPKPSSECSRRTYILGCAHSLVGALMIFGGLFFMLKLSAVTSDQSGFNIGPPIAVIFVGLLAFSNGGQFFENGLMLLRRCVYESIIYCIELKGTVYRSEVGAGMAGNDSFRSSSVAVRCELFVDYAVAACVSEGSGDERRLLELCVDDEVKKQLAMLKETVEQNEFRGASVLGMSVQGSSQVADIAQANKVNFDAQQASIAGNAAMAQRAVQEPAGASGPFIHPGVAQPPVTQAGSYGSEPRQTSMSPVAAAQPYYHADPQPLSDISTASPDAVPIQVVGGDDVPTFAREVTTRAEPTKESSTSLFQPVGAKQPNHGLPSTPASTGVSSNAPPAQGSLPSLPEAPPAFPSQQQPVTMASQAAELPGSIMGLPSPASTPPLSPTTPSSIPAAVTPPPRASTAGASMPSSIHTRTRTPEGVSSITAGGMTASAAFAMASTRRAPSHDAVKIITASGNGNPPPSPQVDATKTCPDCAEMVKQAAIVCRFCGRRFD